MIDDPRGRKTPDAREPADRADQPDAAARESSSALDEQTIELDSLADAVLNGDDFDWPAAEARFAADPEQQALVRQLAILARASATGRHASPRPPHRAAPNIRYAPRCSASASSAMSGSPRPRQA